MPFDQAASFLSTLTGRTRSAFNARPAPVPPASVGVTRVGHESSPWPCGLTVWYNEPPDTKGTHHGTQQHRTRAGNQSAGLPRLACRQQGREGLLDPDRSRVVPPRSQGAFASTGSGERRRMFRLSRWKPKQKFVENPFSRDEPPDQYAKEVWFAGVHSDIGGGYPESESALSKFPLIWMVEEAKDAGLRINTAMFNHLSKGHERKGSEHKYTPPNAAADAHQSLTFGWKFLEWFPKRAKHRETRRRSAMGFYIPWGERRRIEANDEIHASVDDRVEQRPDYDPPNLPKTNI